MNATALMLEITRLNLLYRRGTPIVTDDFYDGLLDELNLMISPDEYEAFVRTLTEEAGDTEHNRVISSLRKFKHGETAPLARWLSKYITDCLLIQPKLDGMSFVAQYREGKLCSGTTKGDGDMGQDITAKLTYILPGTIPSILAIEIRGELTLTGDNHIALGFKNRRNGTVGLIRRDVIEPSEIVLCKAFAYEYRELDRQFEDSLGKVDQLKILGSLGFTVAAYTILTPSQIGDADVLQEVLATHLAETRSIVPFSIDGLVICSTEAKNENKYLPDETIAWKMPTDSVSTKVVGIEWGVSKGQLLKPVVLLVPVDIDGSTIGRVTGFNASFIRDSGLGKGSEVAIIKGGDVIPKIVEVTTMVEASLPSICPSCCGDLSWKGVDLACTSEACGESSVKRIAYFLKNLNIENVSETTLKNWGIIDFASLLAWTPTEGYKSQSSFNEQMGLKMFRASSIDLFKSMSCDGLAGTNMDKLISYAGGLHEATNLFFATARGESPDLPFGIGIKMLAKAHTTWMGNHTLLADIITDERYVGSFTTINPPQQTSGNLSGKSFLLTGTMSQPRKTIEKLIVDNGGSIASGVSKTLDYLVAGESAGSKLDKAQKLGVTVLGEATLLEMVACVYDAVQEPSPESVEITKYEQQSLFA